MEGSHLPASIAGQGFIQPRVTHFILGTVWAWLRAEAPPAGLAEKRGSEGRPESLGLCLQFSKLF